MLNFDQTAPGRSCTPRKREKRKARLVSVRFSDVILVLATVPLLDWKLVLLLNDKMLPKKKHRLVSIAAALYSVM